MINDIKELNKNSEKIIKRKKIYIKKEKVKQLYFILIRMKYINRKKLWGRCCCSINILVHFFIVNEKADGNCDGNEQ